MSINEATPQDWDRLQKKHPAIDESLMQVYLDMAEKETAHSSRDNAVEDVVAKPYHYNTGNIECIEAIEESMSEFAFKGYLKGNCMKYLWRYDYKGKPVEDLQKAQWYLARLLKEVEFDNEED